MNTIDTFNKADKSLIFRKSNEIRVKGSALIKVWDGDEIEVQMYPYSVFVKDAESHAEGMTNAELIKAIFDNANDGDFGCEKILAVDVDLYFVYENDSTDTKLIHFESLKLTEEDIEHK